MPNVWQTCPYNFFQTSKNQSLSNVHVHGLGFSQGTLSKTKGSAYVRTTLESKSYYSGFLNVKIFQLKNIDLDTKNMHFL